jgi:hypothetical protein
MALSPRGFPAVPWPALAVGVFAALEALFLFLVPGFGFSSPGVSPLAFEEFWFQPGRTLSLQQLLMGGNVVLGVVLWASLRFAGAENGQSWPVRFFSHLAAGALLALVHWGCRSLSMSAPAVLITRIHP